MPRHKTTDTSSPKKRTTNQVYFLECHGFIKIGTASDARARHRAVQTVSPFEVKLLCAIPGNEALERSLHNRFWYLRERGEWFRSEPNLTEFVAECLERTRSENLAAFIAASTCDRCGKQSRVSEKRAAVEAAVVPMKFVQNIDCFGCVLAEARTFRPAMPNSSSPPT